LLHAQAFEELGETTEDQMQSLWVDTIDDLRKRFPKSTEISVRGDTKVDLVLQLTTTVTRLNRLAGISNPVELFEKAPKKTAKGARASTMTVIDMLLELVGRGFLDTPDPDIDDEEDKLVISAIQTALFYFMWKGRALKEAVENAEAVPDVDVDEIKERTETFSDKLIATLSSRAGLDPCRLQATGSLLDLYTIFRSILTSKKAEASLTENDFSHLLTLVRHIAPEVQEEITSIFATAEKHYANKAHKTLEPPADNDDPEDIDSDPEDEDEGLTDAERQVDGLKAELQLCDLTSKLVLAIYARVIDAEGAMEGKLKHRMLRNRRRLGPNVTQILAVLEEPNPKKGKKGKSSGGKRPKESDVRSKMKSLEIVVDDDEDEEEEEVDEEERRRQELIDEEGPPSEDEPDEQIVEDEDEDILGD
jgi:cohesin complex subunit SA-1/2